MSKEARAGGAVGTVETGPGEETLGPQPSVDLVVPPDTWAGKTRIEHPLFSQSSNFIVAFRVKDLSWQMSHCT